MYTSKHQIFNFPGFFFLLYRLPPDVGSPAHVVDREHRIERIVVDPPGCKKSLEASDAMPRKKQGTPVKSAECCTASDSYIFHCTVTPLCYWSCSASQRQESIPRWFRYKCIFNTTITNFDKSMIFLQLVCSVTHFQLSNQLIILSLTCHQQLSC